MKHIVLILICLFSFQNFDAQVINTDRPDQTESALVIPQGSFQIETGFGIDVLGNSSSMLLPTNLFRLNLGKGIELRVVNEIERMNTTYFQTSSQWIVNDLQIGTKIQLFNKEDSKTDIALLAHGILPTSSLRNVKEDYGFITKLCIAHELNEKTNLGYNIGYNGYNLGPTNMIAYFQVTYSVAFGRSISDKMSVYIESFGEFDSEDHFAKGDAGLTYLLRDNFQLDFSFGTGINHSMNYVATGFSWNISPN